MEIKNTITVRSGIVIGAQFGAKAGLALSILYSAPWVLLLIIFPPLGLVVFVFALIFGIVPGIILGSVSGAVIGGILIRFEKHITELKAVIVGILIAGVMALVVNLSLHPLLEFQKAIKDLMYWFLLGIPSLIYIGAGAWVGRKFYKYLHLPVPAPDTTVDTAIPKPSEF